MLLGRSFEGVGSHYTERQRHCHWKTHCHTGCTGICRSETKKTEMGIFHRRNTSARPLIQLPPHSLFVFCFGRRLRSGDWEIEGFLEILRGAPSSGGGGRGRGGRGKAPSGGSFKLLERNITGSAAIAVSQAAPSPRAAPGARGVH